MMNRRSLMGGLASAPLLVAGAVQAQTPATPLSGIDVTAPRVQPAIQPYTAEELYRPAPAVDADLSTDGKHVGLLVDASQGDQRATELLVFSADDPTVGEARFTLGSTNANWARWAGSERMLVGVSGSSPTDFNSRTRNYQLFTDQERELPYRRVMVVSLDGTPAVQLFQPAASPRVRVPPERFRKVLNLSEIVAVTDDDHALMAAFDKEETAARWLSYPSRHGAAISVGLRQFYASQSMERGPPLSTVSLYRVDLKTGEPALLQEGANLTVRWEAQNGQPILRRDIAQDGKSDIWRTQAGGIGPWKPMRTVSRADPDLNYLVASDTPRVAWVLARAAGERFRSVRQWSIDTDTLSAPVSSRPDREPVSILFDTEGRFLLASYRGPTGLSHDSPDANLKAVLATLAVQFGDGAAVKVQHLSPDKTKMLIEVSGPQQPRAFYLFDSGRRRLADIGGGQRLKPERLGDAEPVSVARGEADPLQGVLTSSLDGKPGPLVVVLQAANDPESLYSFDPMAQLFATRGWWTLRIPDAGAAQTEALIAASVAQASLDPGKVAILGQGQAGRSALGQAAPYRAAISFDSPEPEADLLAGASVGPRDKNAVRATVGGKPILIVRNWRDARGGRQSDHRTGDAFMQNDAGTLADAIAIGEAGDADWTKLDSVVARAVAVVDFLDPLLR